MSLNDPLSNTLSNILNCEKKGMASCEIKPSSNVIKAVLNVLKEHKYLGDFEVVTEDRGGLLKVNLIGNINKCGAIKPRFSLTKKNYELFEKRYLLAKGFGLLIVTTSKGIMSHKDALAQSIGGKLLASCY